jgi:hypothetical protein
LRATGRRPFTFSGVTLQYQNYAVCQQCGRTLTRDAAREDGWLIAPSKHHPEVDIIRCFRHITLRSLDRSFAGRTKWWISRMYEGRTRAALEPKGINPMHEPFPLSDDL